MTIKVNDIVSFKTQCELNGLCGRVAAVYKNTIDVILPDKATRLAFREYELIKREKSLKS